MKISLFWKSSIILQVQSNSIYCSASICESISSDTPLAYKSLCHISGAKEFVYNTLTWLPLLKIRTTVAVSLLELYCLEDYRKQTGLRYSVFKNCCTLKQRWEYHVSQEYLWLPQLDGRLKAKLGLQLTVLEVILPSQPHL